MNQLTTLLLKRKRLVGWSGGLLVALITGLLFSQSFGTSFKEYKTYRDSITQLKEYETSFTQDILKSRYELFTSYDSIVQNFEKQEKIHQHLNQIPSFVRGTEQQELKRILKERYTALEQKENLSEWFKSRNALLKNSLRYLPFLAGQLEAKKIKPISQPTPRKSQSKPSQANQVPEASLQRITTPSTLTVEQNATINQTLNQLIRSLLLYNVSGEDQLAKRAKSLAKQLSDFENSLEIPKDQLPTQIFRSHANVILTTKPLVEELTEQLILPLGQHTSHLEITLEKSYQQAERRSILFRGLSLAWIVLLIGSGNYIWWRWFRYRDPAFNQYQRQVALLAKMATQLLSDQDESKPFALPFSSLLERQDSLGQLARSLKLVQDNVAESQHASQAESFTFLTARLSLLTKNRRKLINSDAAACLQEAFIGILSHYHCELIDIQFGIDQVVLCFSYPLTQSLALLLRHLKLDSASVLFPIVEDFDPTLSTPDDIWSDAHLIASCEASTHEQTSDLLALQREL